MKRIVGEVITLITFFYNIVFGSKDVVEPGQITIGHRSIYVEFTNSDSIRWQGPYNYSHSKTRCRV